jgi:hypothetical protein
MGLIRRKWTPKQADEWTREDMLAIILSPVIYCALMLGTALSMLLIPAGFVILAAGIILLAVMIYIIHPKLSTLSEDYEKKQKAYLQTLEKIVRWEDDDE